MNRRLGFALTLLGLIAVVFVFDLERFLTLEYLTQQKGALQGLVASYPFLSVAIFTLLYVVITALSVPGALVMTLAAGALFGLLVGVLLVSVGSTVGATLAFLSSRYLMRSWVERHFPRQIQAINRGMEKEGAFYLFALRLIPAFPFFLVNLAMGVTRIGVLTFFWVSQVGMLPATLVFVNTGRELSKVESLADIVSPGLIGSFVLLGVFPFLAKKLLAWWKLQRALKGADRPKRFDRNLVVIGAGAGGLVSSYIAATVRAKVTLIEKNKMGGDCLNTGCVPSKALIKAAKMAADSRRAYELGINTGPVEIDFTRVMQAVHGAIKLVEPHDSVERYSKLGVECIQGQATVVSPYSVRVGEQTLTTQSIIVASGARPFVPAFDGLDQISYYTSDTIWSLSVLPKVLLILGGGPIGCEMAQAFSRLGAKVVLVDRSSRVMSKEDEDVSCFVMSALCKDGVDLRMSHHIQQFKVEGEKKVLVCEAVEGVAEIGFDEVLVALGRKANTEGMGLDKMGVELRENGTIKTDEYLRTAVPTIFACGDVAGPYQFTHIAAHQAWYASVNALFGWVKKFKVDYSVVPWVTYVDPEVARVGLNEAEAKSQNIAFEVTRYSLSELDRAITDHNAQGFIKVITPVGKDRILGVTIVGQNAGELLAEFVLAMKKGIGLNGILSTIHAYPTMAEANKYVAGEWKRKHAPQNLLKIVEKCLAWRRG